MKYIVVENFTDCHTGELRKTTDEPIELSDERVKEIQKTESLIGYQLIKPVDEIQKEEKESKNKDSKIKK